MNQTAHSNARVIETGRGFPYVFQALILVGGVRLPLLAPKLALAAGFLFIVVGWGL